MRSEARPRADSSAQSVPTRPEDGPSSLVSRGALQSHVVVLALVWKPAGRAAVLDMAAWEALIDWLEDMEDLAIVQAALPRLRMGPEKAGMLRWEDVEAEWDDE